MKKEKVASFITLIALCGAILPLNVWATPIQQDTGVQTQQTQQIVSNIQQNSEQNSVIQQDQTAINQGNNGVIQGNIGQTQGEGQNAIIVPQTTVEQSPVVQQTTMQQSTQSIPTSSTIPGSSSAETAKMLKKNVPVSRAYLQKTKTKGIQSYVQPFQNQTTTLSGLTVRSTMYFTRVDYWNVKNATFTLNFEVTQLASNQDSDITVSLNGVKFYSFRPNDKKGRQTIQISLPKDLIQTSNTLTIDGQVLTKDTKGNYRDIQTPANWLTIYDGSNVNFEFSIQQPKNEIRSFYNHFTGVDTLGNKQSVILVPENANISELQAATYALAGMSRLITTDNTTLPMNSLNNKIYTREPYQIVIAEYKNLPKKYKRYISSEDVANKACLRYIKTGNQHILIVTANTKELLIRAGRYIANQELMQETAQSKKIITESTSTFSSSLQSNGNYPLETNEQKLEGPNHQEQVYFIQLPSDQNNAKGSYVNLNFRYSKNIDFSTSLITVYVNNTPIGSKKLTKENANKDHLRVEIPKDMKLSNSFVIKVAFDLNMKDNNSDNMQTPWAYIENNSNAFIKTKSSPDVLFENYPSILITQRSFNNIGVQLPDKMNNEYYATLSNIFNLIGNYTESNIGTIDFFHEKMTKTDIMNHNLIVIGTPDDNPLIREYNNQLYFKYNNNFSTFKSNEKLSIESEYGRHLGTAQLLFNPFDNEKVALFVTGVTPTQVLLASSQIDTQEHVANLKGDAVAVDEDGQVYNYRFKSKANYKENITIVKELKDNPKLKWYAAIGLMVFILLILLIIFLVRKYQVRH